MSGNRRGTAEVFEESSLGAFEVVADQGLVRLAGELDVAAVPALAATLVPTDGDLVVDCSGLTFFDCAALSVLVGAREACQAAGVELILVDPPPCVVRVLELTDSDGLFAVHSD